MLIFGMGEWLCIEKYIDIENIGLRISKMTYLLIIQIQNTKGKCTSLGDTNETISSCNYIQYVTRKAVVRKGR